MERRWRTLAGMVALVPLALGGCNLIVGITSGTPNTGGAGGATSSSATHSSSGTSTSSATSTSSVTSTSGSGGSGGQAGGLSVSPSSASLLSLTTLTFTATLDGSPAANVTWTVVDAGGGSVTSPGGVYTAPQATGTFHVQATLGSKSSTASVSVVQTVTPTVLIAGGELMTATGHGSQSHLAYAENAQQWWLFHDPASGAELATLFSGDFSTWQPGESLVFAPAPGPDGDGRDLSVAYRSINGHDVVHIAQDYLDWPDGGDATLGHYHIRATLSAGHAAFGTPGSLISLDNGMSAGTWPDGPATGILANGQVIDTSGYVGTGSLGPAGSLGPCGVGDADAFTSVGMDLGSSSFDSADFSAQVLWCVPGILGSHQIVTVGDTALVLYDDGGSEPPGNVLANPYVNGAFSPVEPPSGTPITPPLVFSPGAQFDHDDWTATVVGSAVHAVLRTNCNPMCSYEHAILSSIGGAWQTGGAIPQLSTLPASGLFLAPYADGVILVALTADNGSQLVYTYFDGTSWSLWQNLTATSTDQRNWLSGYAPPSATGVKPAVVWTLTAGSDYAIGGLLLP